MFTDLDCMHGQKPLNGTLGCRSIGLKGCIPSITGLECRNEMHKCNGCLGYAVLQITLVKEETWTSGLHLSLKLHVHYQSWI